MAFALVYTEMRAPNAADVELLAFPTAAEPLAWSIAGPVWAGTSELGPRAVGQAWVSHFWIALKAAESSSM
jgi:hypothetical protein